MSSSSQNRSSSTRQRSPTKISITPNSIDKPIPQGKYGGGYNMNKIRDPSPPVKPRHQGKYGGGWDMNKSRDPSPIKSRLKDKY